MNFFNFYRKIRKAKDTGGDVEFNMYSDVDTIIDVGVAGGTPWLYSAFEKQQFILIDPIPMNEPDLLRQIKLSKVEFFEKGLSYKREKVKIFVDLQASSLSSMCSRTQVSDRGHELEVREVEVVQLDSLLEESRFDIGKLGIKIDTEGYELNILKGAKKTLKKCDFIISEVSTSKRFFDSYSFSELITFLFENGFEVNKVIRCSSSKKGLIRTMDVLFTKIEC